MSESHSVLLPYRDSQSEDDWTDQTEKQESSSSSNKKRRRFVLPALLTLSIVLNVAFALNLILAKDLKLTKEQLNGPLYSSPVTRDMDMSLQTKRYNGTFHQTIYTQDPSPEVDEAWLELGAGDVFFTLTLEEGKKYGLRKGHHVRLAPQVGQGFVAGTEANHQLHCLNLLRKMVFFNHEYYQSRKIPPFSDTPEIMKGHFFHCVEILRQQLTCQPNLNVFGQVWIKPSENEAAFPFGDSNTEQKCRSWDAFKEWVDARKYPNGRTWVKFQDDDSASYSEFP